jgi:hypothetical protein
MTGEHQPPAELTAEQAEWADYLLDKCGLSAYADATLSMMGQSGSVRYGLGRCGEHLVDLTPTEIQQFVLKSLSSQGSLPADTK